MVLMDRAVQVVLAAPAAGRILMVSVEGRMVPLIDLVRVGQETALLPSDRLWVDPGDRAVLADLHQTTSEVLKGRVARGGREIGASADGRRTADGIEATSCPPRWSPARNGRWRISLPC